MSSNNTRSTASLSLLVLNDLRLRLDIDTEAWLRILVLGVSCGMISAAILTKVDNEIRRMHLDNTRFDYQYQPWVNRLPSGLRGLFITCSKFEWREAEHAVERENQHESVPPSQWDLQDIGLGVWITAIYLLMSEHSSQKLTPHKYWLDCYFQRRERMWDEVFDESVYPPHVSALVVAFCAASFSSVSTHTCCEFRWHRHPLELRQCYAAAYLLLHPESQHVPLLKLLRRPVLCSWCQDDQCLNCEQCQKLPEIALNFGALREASEATSMNLLIQPLVPMQIMVSDDMIQPEDMDLDSKSEPEDYPLPANVAHWISMSPGPDPRSITQVPVAESADP
ncbi:hypothetical protein BDZ89DRAFT_1148097 [Hymenopellis radicata]|nr:hypothetical protein BDZ89DRAFT_1148097 [Hymenopellis radicata]